MRAGKIRALVAAALVVAGCSASPSERFGLEPSTTTSTPAAASEPQVAESPSDPITLAGTGDQSTAPFNLDGSYVVDITVNAPCGYFSPRLHSTAQDATVESLPSLSEPGERTTHVYGLPQGEYYIGISSGPDCPWEITVTPRP